MAHDDDDQRRSSDLTLRIIPPLLIGALLVAFAIANSQRTTVDLVFTSTRAPLVLVLAITAVAGALMASFIKFERRHHH